MGYFNRPIRRGAARKERLAHLEPLQAINAADWKHYDLSSRPPAESFLRFVIDHPGSGMIGLFRSSEILKEDESFPAMARSELRSIFNWFNKNLAAPRRLPQNAVCWFRSDSDEFISQMRSLVEFYRFVDHPVLMQTTRNPGRVVYRDAYQVAAVPYRDRRMTSDVM